MTVPARRPEDDALDRLEADDFVPSIKAELNTIRESLIEARESRDHYSNEVHRLRDALERQQSRIYILENMRSENYIETLEAAEAEVRQLREERDGAREALGLNAPLILDLTRENRRLTEGLRERDEIIDCLLQRGHFDPFVPLAAFRKIVPKGAYSVETYDEEKEWLARIEARALLSANPPQGDAAAGSSPSDDDPPCPRCGMTAQVEASRSEPGRWMCHGCAQTFASPSDGGGAK